MHRMLFVPVLLACGLAACHQNGPNPTPSPPPQPDPAKRPVNIDRELMVTDLRTIESDLALAPDGPWTFGRLFKNLSPSDDKAKEMLFRWIATWEKDQALNGDLAPSRPSIRDVIIKPWKARDGKSDVSDQAWDIDWNHAPFRLLAIVNRIDLRRDESGRQNAGEGRFVFGVHDNAEPTPTDPGENPLRFTVIFEFEQVAADRQAVLNWARAWHALGELEPGPAYNKALRAITDRFAARGVAPQKPNGSALNQIRTNEIRLSAPWELREFALDRATGLLLPTTVKQTPRDNLDGTSALADFINDPARTESLRKGTFTIDPGTDGVNFLGVRSSVPVNFSWNAPGADPAALRGLAFQTCNGCHHQESGINRELGASQKVGAGFVHIAPRRRGDPTELSSFLTGKAVNGQASRFNDLEDRARGTFGLEALLGISQAPASRSLPFELSENARRSRVH